MITRHSQVAAPGLLPGAGDMLCRVVARTNADLQRVLDAIVSVDGVVRASTAISLATQVPYRILPLVAAASDARVLSGQSVLLRTDKEGM